MTQSVETSPDGSAPGVGAMEEGETIRQRLTREEAEERALIYSPAMSDEEIDVFIARLHDNADEWTEEQREPTDSVNLLREMREARSEALYRRSRDANRR